MSDRFSQARDSFADALARFEEALAVERTNPLALDGTIQRFEFTIEMAWRALKHAAADQSIATASPRQALEAGFRLGLIDDDGSWPAMLADRNESTHTYKKERAEALYARLPGHAIRFRALLEKLTDINAAE